MKMLISHIRRLLPAIFVVLFLAFGMVAQTPNAKKAGAETPFAGVPDTLNPNSLRRNADLDISGDMAARIFPVRSLFNAINGRISMISGIGNYFAGDSAGRVNTGNRNSLVGYQAGYRNIGGSNNAFLGYQAGYSNT